MYPSFSIKKYTKELLRPWKLATFSVALSYYVWGAHYYRMPTWDVPVSVIMSLLTYVFAPWVVNLLFYLIKERPKKSGWKLIACFLVTYICASGSYEVYHMTVGIGFHPPTYWVNLYYSTLIFIAAGMFWRFEGTLWELLIRLGDSLKRTYIANKVKFVLVSVALFLLLVISIWHSLQIDRL